MSRVIVVVFVVVASALSFSRSKVGAHSSESDGCYATAQTQFELNQCANTEAQRAEAELGALYARLLAKAPQPAYRKKIETAQKAWTAYREAELELLYPAEDKQANYGSMYPMCCANDRAQLTRRRSREIRALLRGDNKCAEEWIGPKPN